MSIAGALKTVTKSALKLVAPATVNRTVTMPRRKPNSVYRTREHLTDAEVDWLIDAAKANRWGHRDATMILVAFRHGLRSSELVDLRWDQIDFTHAVLHVRRAKKGTPATHPVDKTTSRCCTSVRLRRLLSQVVCGDRGCLNAYRRAYCIGSGGGSIGRNATGRKRCGWRLKNCGGKIGNEHDAASGSYRLERACAYKPTMAQAEALRWKCNYTSYVSPERVVANITSEGLLRASSFKGLSKKN